MSCISENTVKNDPPAVFIPSWLLDLKRKKASMETCTLLKIIQNRMSEVRVSQTKQMNLAGLCEQSRGLVDQSRLRSAGPSHVE